MSTLAFSGFINSFLVFLIGIFVYSSNRKKLENQLFFTLCLGIVFWQGNYGFWQMADSEKGSLFFLRLITIGSVLSSVIFLHLVLALLNLIEKRKKILNWSYLVTLLILGFVFSPFYISEVRAYPFYSYWPIAGTGTTLNIIWGLILAGAAFWLLIRSYRRSSGERKNQVGYFILALSILCVAGLFNLPQWYGIPLFPYGNFLIFLYPLIISFAIVKYHLFEIKVVLTEMLVGLMAIVLAGEIFMFENFQTKMLGFGIFLLFCFTGYLLVRATRQEIKKREEVEKLANRLKEASKNIEELSRMKTEFLKVVNHQLRTPVTIIKGMLSMMVEGTVKGKELNEYIKKTYFSSERLTTILDDILLAQRLIGKTEEMLLQPCQIEEITQRVVDHLETQAEMKGLRILFKKPKSPIPVTLADEEKVERALSRLIDNAILYTAKGKIEVSLALRKKEEKAFIQISIKDQGIGLTKEDKKDLFKLFHRGERATLLHPNGSGLGLFIVKNLVEAHQGQIEAESKGKDKGTTFIITLPVVSEI